MPSATIIGSPASGAKTLRRVDYATERNGLETLTETYTIRTADRATIQPAFLTTHKNFSTSSIKYERMAVENFSFRAQDGDISELTVTFVGLTYDTGLPGALVRIQPAAPKIIIQAEYVSDINESQLIALAGSPYNRMPNSINGTNMPVNPPFYTNNNNSYTYYGYTYFSTEATRRGQFIVATVVFKEYSVQF